MSWKEHLDTCEGIRRVRWDALWHVLYTVRHGDSERNTYDRVTQRSAMAAWRKIDAWRRRPDVPK